MNIRSSSIKIINAKRDQFGNIIIDVDTKETSMLCKNCGEMTHARIGLGNPRTIEYTPIFGVPTFITYKPHKYICNKCEGHPITAFHL